MINVLFFRLQHIYIIERGIFIVILYEIIPIIKFRGGSIRTLKFLTRINFDAFFAW